MLRPGPRPEPRAWLPLALLVSGAFWLLTRQHVLTIDSYYYLQDAESAPWRQLWHPHHLLLEPLLRLYWNLWGWFAWPERAVLPFQLLSVATMLAALALAARMLRAVLGRTLATPLWWLLVAGSYQAWYFGTQAEGVPQYALMGAVYLVWAAELPARAARAPLGRREALLLAATIAAATLLHQALVLPAPLLAAMLAREAPPGQRLRLGALCLGVAAAVVLAVSVPAGARVTGSLAPATLWDWLTGYREEFARCCGSWRLLISPDVPRGLGAAFFTGDPLAPYVFGERPLDAAFLLRLAPPAMLASVLLGGLLGLPRAWRARDPIQRRALLNLAMVVLVGTLFAGWWEPANRKFWSPVLPGLVALAAVGWQAWWPRWPRARAALPVLLAALMVGYNLVGAILPRHRTHDARQPLVEYLVRRTAPRDAVVLVEDRVWLAAGYWQPERTIHGLPGPRSSRGDARQSVVQAAAADAVRALREGATLHVTRAAWPELQPWLPPRLRRLPPRPVLWFGDADLGVEDQLLLTISSSPADR